MRYLKLYEELNSEMPVNKELIADLKELSMNLLDEGFSLSIWFYDSEAPKNVAYGGAIGLVNMNHRYGDKYHRYDNDEASDRNKINYVFAYNSPSFDTKIGRRDFKKNNLMYKNMDKEVKKILRDIKKMYPDENIRTLVDSYNKKPILYENVNTTEDDFEQDIKHILLEAEDLGYETRLIPRTTENSIIIHHYRQRGLYASIDFSQIKDCLLRLKDYLGDRYIDFQIYHKERWKESDLTDDTSPEEIISSTCIHYTKE